MRQHRHLIASALVGVLIYGGLFAPLYHSLYMAMGDFHPQSGMMAHHMDEEPCHGTVPKATIHDQEGPALGAPVEGHPECPFMELFAMSLLSLEVKATLVGPIATQDAYLRRIAVFYWQDTTHSSYSLRGPPLT